VRSSACHRGLGEGRQRARQCRHRRRLLRPRPSAAAAAGMQGKSLEPLPDLTSRRQQATWIHATQERGPCPCASRLEDPKPLLNRGPCPRRDPASSQVRAESSGNHIREVPDPPGHARFALPEASRRRCPAPRTSAPSLRPDKGPALGPTATTKKPATPSGASIASPSGLANLIVRALASLMRPATACHNRRGQKP
jgi:hypothetical protein